MHISQQTISRHRRPHFRNRLVKQYVISFFGNASPLASSSYRLLSRNSLQALNVGLWFRLHFTAKFNGYNLQQPPLLLHELIFLNLHLPRKLPKCIFFLTSQLNVWDIHAVAMSGDWFDLGCNWDNAGSHAAIFSPACWRTSYVHLV